MVILFYTGLILFTASCLYFTIQYLAQRLGIAGLAV